MKKFILFYGLMLIAAITIYVQQSVFPTLAGYYFAQKPPEIVLKIYVSKIFKQEAHNSSMFTLDGKEVIRYHSSCNAIIPSQFSWLEKGIMTPVKHQMNLGSCGVFAAVAVFESLIKKEIGKTVDLSEQQIINGCEDWVPSGISSVDAMKYMKQFGLVLEERLPYQDKKGNEMPNGPPDYILTDYHCVYTNKLVLSEKIKTIKHAVLEYGPVAKNMIFFKDLDQYKKDIYIHDSKSEEQGGHWVVIVGWQDVPKVKNGGYWICRNSWGDRWGENGYFNIAYGECGIDDFWFVYGIFKSHEATISSHQLIKQITKNPAHDYHVKWSPDGKMIAFTSQRNGEAKIWLIPADGGDAVILETGLSGDHHISWAPDGKLITFDARWGGIPNIFTVSLDNGKTKRLSKDGTIDFQPCWSPDGLRIAFASLRSGNEDIWIIPADGGQPTQLTHNEADDFHPVWFPDGSKIAFTSNRSGNKDIWIIPSSGGEAKQLTFDDGDEDQACWSPDGTQIAFMSRRSGKQDIWITSISGGNPVRFTEESDNSWPIWSLDGKRIAFTSNRTGNLDIWVKDLK